MAKKQYPHVMTSRAYKIPVQGNLCFCGQLASHKVEIAVSWFRGDDITRPRCLDHINDPRSAKYGDSQLHQHSRKP